MIRVLIIEDSPVAQELLVHILSSDPEITVIGTANDGEEAIEQAILNRPDVITMDIHMPKLDGFEATRRIMELKPVPIVIVTGSPDVREVSTSFKAMEAGALAVVSKPQGINSPDYEEAARELVQTVKLMSEVKVVRRWVYSRKDSSAPAVPSETKKEIKGTTSEIKVVAIGASTGGPLVLQTILSGLGKNFPVPVLIVQHMSTGFVQGMAEWISESTGFPVHVASSGEYILSGKAYVAPDGFHMGVDGSNRIILSSSPPENGLRPAVSHLFRSVAKAYGRNAVGVLLTGMGNDGAEGLKMMRDEGSVTIAQDESSSVIFGMPKAAIELEAAMYVLPSDKIAGFLKSLINQRKDH
jgi:two-component system, chemotaxis family, protein-glutamate methylesterase/glutaminase